MKLEIELENCFGIGKLKHTFDFPEKKNTCLIYAPNGTMKSSFAKVFDLLSKKQSTNKLDRVYPERVSKCNITVDNEAINPDSIFVVNAEEKDFDSSSKISSFLASKELKEEYELIYSELDAFKKLLINKIKTISKSTDIEAEFEKAFEHEEYKDFYNLLVLNENVLQNKYQQYTFRYNYVFDKKNKVKDFINSNKELIIKYFDNYQLILERSKFFKKTKGATFGTLQANELLESTKDGAFFDANHKIVLEDQAEITTYEMFKDLVEKEIDEIINNEELKKIFDDIDKKLSGNVELKLFKSVLEIDNSLIIKLIDYEDFRKEVLLSYFTAFKDDVNVLIINFKAKKVRLDEIIESAKKEQEIWQNIVNQFNSRFYVPFKVRIENLDDIILKKKNANLIFDYFDSKELPKLQTKDELLKVLSKGEQRAYYILQILFEIESRRNNGITNIIIFDDIADSFDYKNKYAIVEYIKDLQGNSVYYSIVLTHNFDFYRTVASRLSLGNSVFMAYKNDERCIELKSGQYRKEVFEHFIKNANKPAFFISMIPFVRNIVEFIDESESDSYMSLTKCLHIKKDSDEITTNIVLEIFRSKISKCKNLSIEFKDIKIKDFIFDISKKIVDNQNDEIALENKIVISIAIRLYAETFMLGFLGEHFDVEKKTKNPTRVLFDLCKNSPEFDNDKLKILDRVVLMTPENIHINAFMYEPLIDMSIDHLIDLYHDVLKLS